MSCKKIVYNFSKILFEPRGSVNQNNIEINTHLIPDIDLINKKIKNYCKRKSEFTHIFYKKNEKIKCYLKMEFPDIIVKNILENIGEIQKHTYHLIYNYWYKDYIDILTRIREEYELYDDWANIYSYEIFKNIDLKEKELKNTMQMFISEIPI